MNKYKKILLIIIVIIFTFSLLSCSNNKKVNELEKEVADLQKQLSEKESAITTQGTTTITTITESSSRQLEIDDYNKRLAEFISLLNKIDLNENNKHWAIIYPLMELKSNDYAEINSAAKQIITEFELWGNEIEEITASDFTLNLLNYFIEWTKAGIEFYTPYSLENPEGYDVATMEQLKENLTSTLQKAADEKDKIITNFNKEANDLGLEKPFPTPKITSTETTETSEVETTALLEKGTKENPWPFGTVVTGPEVSWKLLSAKDLGNKLNSNNMFIEDKTTSGTFIKVEAIIKNLGSTKKDTTFLLFNLVDNKGREFGELPDAYAFTGEEINTDYIEEINPGMERDYIFIFEVPLDAKGLMFEATDLEILFPSKTYISLGF